MDFIISLSRAATFASGFSTIFLSIMESPRVLVDLIFLSSFWFGPKNQNCIIKTDLILTMVIWMLTLLKDILHNYEDIDSAWRACHSNFLDSLASSIIWVSTYFGLRHQNQSRISRWQRTLKCFDQLFPLINLRYHLYASSRSLILLKNHDGPLCDYSWATRLSHSSRSGSLPLPFISWMSYHVYRSSLRAKDLCRYLQRFAFCPEFSRYHFTYFKWHFILF